MQAAHRNQRGDDLEEDDEEVERLRQKQSKLSPFNRVCIDRTKERHRIVEWVRKRQVRRQRGHILFTFWKGSRFSDAYHTPCLLRFGRWSTDCPHRQR